MIALITTPAGITRLNYFLTSDSGVSSTFPSGTVVSFDPAVRDAAHEHGFAVVPDVFVGHSATARRQSAAGRLKQFKTSLLNKRWIAKAAARWFKPLNIAYRALETPLQGSPTSQIARLAGALSAALESEDPTGPVYIDATLGALVVDQAGVSTDRLRVL